MLSKISHNVVKGAITYEIALKALIVDDSELDRLILEKLLLKNGYNVYIATNGYMAIDVFNECQPDIVFMDLYLPEITGFEVTKQIKKIAGDHYVPIMFVTGASDEDTLGRCLESGGDDYIVKPIRENILKAKANVLLRMKKMHDELRFEKERVTVFNALQTKDLKDANKVISNIHKPLFYETKNISWRFVAQNILTGDILCSAIGPSNNHVMLIGDNTGHGLPAAIGSMITCETFYTMVKKGFDVDVIIEEINKKLYKLLPVDRFLAASIIEIDDEYSLMKIWNAGLPDVLVCDPDGNVIQKLPSLHMPLGIRQMKTSDVVPMRINIHDGDYVYVFTDGLTEVFNEVGEMLEEQQLFEIIKSANITENRVDTIVNNISEFIGNQNQADDILLLEIKCDSSFVSSKKSQRKVCVSKLEPMDWHVKFDFQSEFIRNSNPTPILLQAISDIQGLGDHREKLFLILTEMYSNALEHGLLKLDSSIKEEENGFLKYYELRQTMIKELLDGKISIDIEHYIEDTKGIVSITLTHNGASFDSTQYEDASAGENNKFSGRGIALMRSLCRKHEYSDGGKKLNIEYEWEYVSAADID
jgi:two-component system, HptB-dependent secretion and biofilm response regulator